MFRCCFCCPAMHACSDGQFSAPIDSQQQSFQLCDYFNYATMIKVPLYLVATGYGSSLNHTAALLMSQAACMQAA